MASAANKCLLLVEDDALVRVTIAMMLEDEGFEVVEAADAAAATLLFRDGLQASVLVTDVDLGYGQSGPELADVVHQMQPALPIIFITGRVASLEGRQLSRNEAVLPKPFA